MPPAGRDGCRSWRAVRDHEVRIAHRSVPAAPRGAACASWRSGAGGRDDRGDVDTAMNLYRPGVGPVGVLSSAEVRGDRGGRRFRRGVYLLPSMFTLANMFCGYACVVYAMRNEFETAAPFIGVAIVLDMLDGRIARLTGTASAFGLQFDSLADVISFGLAPAVLTFNWGLSSLGRLGWAAGFIFVTAAAMRLARFNIQSATDKRYFVGMPTPAAAAVLASTVFAYPFPIVRYDEAILALLVVIVPALLMVS